jgi:TolA-binding protein
MVVTAAPTAAVAPTIRTGPQAQTVQELAAPQPPAKPKRRGALAAVIVVIVIVLAAVAAVLATRQSEPKVTASQSVVPPQTSAPQSSTAVNVTAPSDATVEETTNTTTTASPVGKVSTTQTTDTAQKTETAAEPTASAAQSESAPGADALYANAMKQVQEGDPMEARKTLHRVLQQDPHYAKAHFRMGEIALFNRNLDYASKELQKALDDTDRLGAREEQLTHLGLAIATHDKAEVDRLSAEVWQRWPRDPDLMRMRETFPGMFGEVRRDVHQPDRGRVRRWQRP